MRPSGNAKRDVARRHIQRGWLPLLLTLDLTGLNPAQLDWQVAAGKLARKVLRGVTVYNLSDVLRLTGADNGMELIDKHYPIANPGRRSKAKCVQRIESHSSETKRKEFNARLERVRRYAVKNDRDVSTRLSTTEWGILTSLLYQAGIHGHTTVCTSIAGLQRSTGKRDPESIYQALRSLASDDVHMLRVEKVGNDGGRVVTLLDPLTGQPFPDDLDTFTDENIPAQRPDNWGQIVAR